MARHSLKESIRWQHTRASVHVSDIENGDYACTYEHQIEAYNKLERLEELLDHIHDDITVEYAFQTTRSDG